MADGPQRPLDRLPQRPAVCMGCLRRERGQVSINYLCSADHEQVWQYYPVDPYSDDFKYILYLYTQQYRYICIIICAMNAAVEPIHVLSVLLYHDTASAAPALLSSPVISTNEDQRILMLRIPPLFKNFSFLRTGTPKRYETLLQKLILCLPHP